MYKNKTVKLCTFYYMFYFPLILGGYLEMISYEAELRLFESILSQFNLQIDVVTDFSQIFMNSEFGARSKLFGDGFAASIELRIKESVKEKVIYRVTDEFLCRYVLMQLPEFDELTLIIVGPYIKEERNGSWIDRFLEERSINPLWYPILENYLRNIPYIPNERIIYAAFNSLAERIWGMHQFTTEEIISGVPDRFLPLSSPPDGQAQEDILSRVKKIERAYQSENQFLDAITQGRIHRAGIMLSNFSRNTLEKRTAPLRNIKNYSIILNTLMRKAVERGGVHPVHIDRLSSEFAVSIENTSSPEDFMELWQEMARKYCLLVRSHSSTNYSQLVQYIIARVDLDLSADLSLKANAEALNVNASYLSSLFRKETGMTLTDYVNRKRIEHAIYLLSTTDIPISVVGQRCGVQDDNYFTKIFRKYTSMSPKQYRLQLKSNMKKPLVPEKK